jgi:hypothetical protein
MMVLQMEESSSECDVSEEAMATTRVLGALQWMDCDYDYDVGREEFGLT